MGQIIESNVTSTDSLPGFSGGKMEIKVSVPGTQLPTYPSAKLSGPTDVSVTVIQTCPGYPACGRKGKACVVQKSSPAMDLSNLLNVNPPKLPDLPAMPSLKYTLRIPNIGFPNMCPNAKVEATPAEKDSQNPSAQSGETASQK